MVERATPGGSTSSFRFGADVVVANRYRVLRPLARGGMGEVYEVEDTQLRQVVALKTLDGRRAADEVAINRFQSEVKNARRIAHANVCRTFDFGVHEDHVHFLTMELLEGEGLDARLQRGPLQGAEFVEVMSQVAAAIDAAHVAGVVHRDLKPSNVMLVQHSGGGVRAVVTDFGIARHLDDTTITRDGWVGTPAYVAPEQLEGKKVGPPADVYALGVMLYEAATGRLPFEGATAVEVAMQRLARAPPSLSEVAPSLPLAWGALIARCLSREPELRPDAGAVKAALLGSKLRAPRRRAALAVRAALVVLVATLGVMGFWRAGTLPSQVVVRAEVKHPFTGEQEWVGRATKRLLERELARDRRFRVDETSGNTALVVDVTLTDGGVRLDARTQRQDFGRPRSTTTVEAQSISAALDQLVPALREELSGGAREPAWTEAELARARQLGAASPEGVAVYGQFIECSVSTIEYERAPCEALSKKLIALEPKWPRAWVSHGMFVAWTPPERTRVLDLVKDSGDTLGKDVLRAQMGETIKVEPLRFDGDDPLMSYAAGVMGVIDFNEVEGVYYRTWKRAPQLQFGSGLFWFWLDAERRRELLAEWKERAPEAMQRIINQPTAEELAGGRVLYGMHPLLLLTDARRSTRLFDFANARLKLRPLLESTDPMMRISGLRLSAEVAIYEGRFSDALSASERAVRSLAPSLESQFSMNFEVNRQLLIGLGETAPARQANAAYLRYLENQPQGADATIALLTYLLDEAKCPALEPRFEKLRGLPDEAQGRSLLTRAAQQRGCQTCEDVMKAGKQSAEFFDASLLDYAVCARSRGEHQLALQALDAISTPGAEVDRWGPSPFHVVLAAFERARVLEAAGQPAEALVAWKNALRFWQTTDRPRAEVKEARDAIARLEARPTP